MSDGLADLQGRVAALEYRVAELEGQAPISSTLSPGSRLTEARNQAGYTQHQLAEKAGVSPNTIINFENGRTHPRLRTLMALADAVGMPYSYLQKGETHDEEE